MFVFEPVLGSLVNGIQVIIGKQPQGRDTQQTIAAKTGLHHKGGSFVICGGTRNIILQTLPPYTKGCLFGSTDLVLGLKQHE